MRPRPFLQGSRLSISGICEADLIERLLVPSSTRDHYTTKIIKAGALLADTRTLLANYDPADTVVQNLDRFRRENIFGKASRSRVEDILVIFRERYLRAPDVIEALATLVRASFPAEALDRLLHYHATQSDPLLHDIVTEFLYERQAAGRTNVEPGDICRVLNQWVAEGRTTKHWSEPTTVRVAQGLPSGSSGKSGIYQRLALK